MTEKGLKNDLTKERASYKGRLIVFETYWNSIDVHSLEETVVSEVRLRMSKIDSLYAQCDEVHTRIECITDDIDATVRVCL